MLFIPSSLTLIKDVRIPLLFTILSMPYVKPLKVNSIFMSALLSGLECEMSSTVLYVWTLGLQVVLLF